jgi:hypothetical protein
MTHKIGRNEPCPCGSGRKYKHCHGRAADAQPEGASAVQRALSWLTERHGKAVQAAFQDLLFEDLWPEDGPEPSDVDESVWQPLMVNIMEWLLAEGDIEVKGAWREINAYVLSSDGPGLSADQRRYIAQFAERPLRLYTVTDVRRGEGLTLADALDDDAQPLVVQERSGSESARPGMLIGCRVLSVGDHLELSGAIYPFSMLAAAGSLEDARSAQDAEVHSDDRPYMLGRAIARAWVRQMVMPAPMPRMLDASSGEPLLLVTDHYQVLDEKALNDALAACADVNPDTAGGWVRSRDDEDGLTRSLAAIHGGKQAGRIEVFYRTQRLADEGREWFEQVSGGTVRHLMREIADPRGALSHSDGAAPPARSNGLPPELVAEAIEKMLLRSYASWADEPIPALGGNTPRQAIQSPGGLERVKGLLRSYEDGETEMARTQGRRPISFQFLWDALGIDR